MRLQRKSPHKAGFGVHMDWLVDAYYWVAGLPVFLQIPLGIAVFLACKEALPHVIAGTILFVRFYLTGLALPFIGLWRWLRNRRESRRQAAQGQESRP